MARTKKPKFNLTPNSLLATLKKHVVDNHQSIHTLHNPPFIFYKKRMEVDIDFKVQVDSIICEGDAALEKLAFDSLHTKDFNDRLWSKLVSNRTFTKDHNLIELNDKLDALLGNKDA